HVRQKPFERGGSNRRPNQPFDDGDLGGVKGMQIGVGFPFFKQQFHLPDIMPPKVEAFTRCTSHPKNGYATGSLWRCPSWWSCSSPPPAPRAGSCYIHDASPHVGIFPWLSMHVNTGRTVPS